MGDLLNQQEKITAQAVTETREPTPMEMIARAIDQGADVEKIERLMALQERWEANQARKAYNEAMRRFKENPPSLYRDRHVSVETQKGGRLEYSHVSLEQAALIIGKALAECGFTHNWKTGRDENGATVVTCILTHEAGHSEETSLTAPADTTGGKNNVQAVGSTVTYLQRYTLLAITGLAVKGQDDDAAMFNRITDDEFEELSSLIAEAGTDAKKFCEHFGISAVRELLGKDYRKAAIMLRQRIKAKEKGAKR